MVEISVASAASSMLFSSASLSSGMLKAFFQCSSVNPTQVKL